MTAHESHARNKSMIIHAAIGVVPIGNLFEGFHAGRYATHGSKLAGVGGAVAASATYPIGGGAAAGAYHGYAKHEKGAKYWKTSSKGKRYQSKRPRRR